MSPQFDRVFLRFEEFIGQEMVALINDILSRLKIIDLQLHNDQLLERKIFVHCLQIRVFLLDFL